MGRYLADTGTDGSVADWLTNFTLLNPGSLYPLYAVKISPTGYEIMAVYLTILGIVATIGNSTVLFVVFKYGTFRKRAINLLIANMAFSDLCISFTGYPLTTISSYSHRWVFGYIGCKFNGFAVFALSSSTMGTHAALAVYRYIYVCHHNWRPKLTRALTCKVLIFLWGHALFWAVTPLIGWSMYDYEPFGTSCSIDWVSRTVNNYSYMLLTTITNYVIPLVIMVGCYWGVIKKSKKVDPLRAEDRDQAVRVITKINRLENRIDSHVTRMCIIMTIGFFVAWTPYAIESIWASHNFVGPVTSTLPTMLAKSSCMMNPFIYLASSSTFRRDVAKIFRRDSPAALPESPRQGERGGAGAAAAPTRGEFFVRDGGNNPGSRRPTMSVYFDKKQIYIGSIAEETIEHERSLANRGDPEVDVQFSSAQGAGKLRHIALGQSGTGKASALSRPVSKSSNLGRIQLTNIAKEESSSKDIHRSNTIDSPIFN